MVPRDSPTRFDPYYKWLGIPLQEQPANHYRLLGVQLFEPDPDVISVAADRQMSHVKTFATGRFGQQSQKVLDELARARLCLLNPIKKDKYDSQLRLDLAATDKIPKAHLENRSLSGERSFSREFGAETDVESESSDFDTTQSPSVPQFRIDDSSVRPVFRSNRRRPSMLMWSISTLLVILFGLAFVLSRPEGPLSNRPVYVGITTTDGAEEGPTEAMIVLELPLALQADTTINFSIEGTVDLGKDAFIMPGLEGTRTQGTFVIPKGIRVVKIPVPVVDDRYVEGDESMTITLTSASSQTGDVALSKSARQATITIVDNDKVKVFLEGDKEQRMEQTNRTSVPVALSQPISTDVVVLYSGRVIYQGSQDAARKASVFQGKCTIPAESISSVISIDTILYSEMTNVIAVTVRLERVVGSSKLASIDQSANSVKFTLAPSEASPKVVEIDIEDRPVPENEPLAHAEAKPVVPQRQALGHGQNPLANLPRYVELPGADSIVPTDLMDITSPVELSLICSDGMTMDAGTISWLGKPDELSQVVASLRQEGSTIIFAWGVSPHEDAVTSLNNSVLHVSADGYETDVALRDPIIIEPFKFDLTKAKQLVICKVDHMPRAETIRFEFLGEGRLPKFNVSGDDPLKLQIREEVILSYTGQEKIGTKLSMRRRGNTVVVEVSSRFALPSGYEGPLTVRERKKKRKELDGLLRSAAKARGEIGKLRSALVRLRSELSEWQNRPTTKRFGGADVSDAGLVMSKRNGIARTESKISRTMRDIQRAEGLIANRTAFEIEMQSLNRISEFVQRIEGSKSVQFRFYTVIDGHEVDLVLSQ